MSVLRNVWPAGVTATMNVTYTQANAAGGAVVCEISPGAGNEFIVLGWRAVNSGTNGVNAGIETAAGGTQIMLIQSIASAAGTTGNIAVGSVATASSGTSASPGGLGYPAIVSGTQALRIAQTAAGAQSDTFQVLMNIRLRKGSLPTVIHSNSTNAANVSVTAGAESFTVLP